MHDPDLGARSGPHFGTRVKQSEVQHGFRTPAEKSTGGFGRGRRRGGTSIQFPTSFVFSGLHKFWKVKIEMELWDAISGLSLVSYFSGLSHA